MNKIVTMAAVAGAGVAGWMMYKKMNPNAAETTKKTVKSAANKVIDKM